MASNLTSNGVVLATAMAVSGTVILLAFRLQKSFPSTQFSIPLSPHSSPRSCISSEGKRREKKKKRVQFAEDVVDPSGNREEFQRRLHSKNTPTKASSVLEKKGGKVRELPANRMALYNGILRDRLLHRVAYSY